MTKTILTVALISIIAYSPVWAHVPSKCIPLFDKAARQTQIVVRKGEEVAAAAQDGLEPGARYDRFEHLADLVAQLLGAQASQYQAVTKAIQCVAAAKD